MLVGVEVLEGRLQLFDRGLGVHRALSKINEFDERSDSPHKAGRSCTRNSCNNRALDVVMFPASHLLDMADTRGKVAYTNALVHQLVP